MGRVSTFPSPTGQAPDTGWLSPAYTNGWIDYGAPWCPGGYRRVGSWVYLRGLIKNGTLSLPCFILPVGFRPATNRERHFPAFSNALLAGVRVNANGSVYVGDPGSAAWFSLDGVYFDTDAGGVFQSGGPPP